MSFNINTIGEGNITHVKDGSGKVQLSAMPEELYLFKHWIVNGNVIIENNIEVDELPEPDITVVFCVTIETYLRGLVGFDVSDIALNSIRVNRQIKKEADINDLSEKVRELAYADLLMWASTNPTSYQGSKMSDDGWTQTEASKTISVTDKKDFRKQAMEIYKKWGDTKYTTKIKIVNLW